MMATPTAHKPIQRTSKVCKKCGGQKPLTEFSKHSGHSDNLQHSCKPCNRRTYLEWEKQNPEKAAAKHFRNNPKSRDASRIKQQIATYGRPVSILEMTHDRYRAARALGFRSGLEVQLAKQLDDNHIPYEYEGITFQYEQPAEQKRHTPDFVLPNFIIVEGKGEWDSSDRKKVKLFLQQHPGIDYRMVFSRSNSRISKKSKTTYADICRTLKIPFADKFIPLSWLTEPLNQKSKAAVEAALNR